MLRVHHRVRERYIAAHESEHTGERDARSQSIHDGSAGLYMYGRARLVVAESGDQRRLPAQDCTEIKSADLGGEQLNDAVRGHSQSRVVLFVATL